MSNDALCVGVCMMDWDAGVCLGCGRSTDEIHGVAAESPPDEQVAVVPADDQAAPLPPKASAQSAESDD